MKDTLVSEYRKIVTTRTWWVLLLVMVAYMAFMGAVLGFALTFDTGDGAGAGGAGFGDDPSAVTTTVYTLPAAFGYALPLLVGLLSVTTEFRHRTLTPTLLAQPDRNRFVLAKLLASVPVGVLYGVLGTLATVGAAAAAFAFTDAPNQLGDAATWGLIARTAAALVVWCVVGVGLGFAMPNQVVAIVVVLAFTQFLEPILRTLLALSDATAPIGKFLPGAAGEAISGGSFYASSGISDLLPPAAGAAVLIGYALVLALLGRLTTLQRDIT
ncbi:ABC transporter permease [Cellulomonas triticagri]|uniref:ABC transporter permease n=1 Tax=Cellulomonas triticagri TaxID=2483352 RepID=A0A3M2IUB7_9CELL|nr:ABC transporter permease [Cellulomonas triticagri]RMI02863.1 ABC transporter permease [Cellulomonas triticagri]